MSALEDIVARKKIDVGRREEQVSYDTLYDVAYPSKHSLKKALDKPGARFILECKKASPSEGLIRKNFDITEVTRVYKNFADAVSVLTDEPYFQGSLDYLSRARSVLDCPILAKDFVTCPYQVREARTKGADAALLMLSVLDDGMYRLCAAEASRLGMDVITEAHSEPELDRAISLGAEIIGINNRNLKTLNVDLGVTASLAEKIPAGRLVICESGIQSHGDVTRMRELNPNIGAFLVGGALMREENMELAVRRLVFGTVKICGLTSREETRIAYEAGASYGGVIFASQSPRGMDVSSALEITSANPLPMTGVFVNEEIEKIASITEFLNLAVVQLHGDESPEYISDLRRKIPENTEIWRAKRVKDSIRGIDRAGANRVLLDTFDEKSRGGTGKTFDWLLLEGIDDKENTILSGGITEQNVCRAMAAGTYAVDVCSGVEFFGKPGKKDPEKIENLFKRLRGA